jgi:hypothetical protein
MVYALMAANLVLVVVVTAARARAMKRQQEQALRRARRRCLKCGYDLRVHSGRCPECGEPVPRRLTRCSFCGRSNQETGAQVEGPNDVYICNHCVTVASDIFAAERQRAEQPVLTAGVPPQP